MSEDLFEKIDALMNRHRPGSPLPSGGGYLPLHPSIPTLTEIIEETHPPAISMPLATTQPVTVAPNETVDLFHGHIDPDPPTIDLPDSVSLHLDETSMISLERSLRNMLETRVAVQVARRVDLAMGELLEAVRIEIEHMVHDAVEQELRQFAARQHLQQTRLD